MFRAALAVANQDIEGVGEYCLRCHTPRAWLEGRSTPTDGSALNQEDIQVRVNLSRFSVGDHLIKLSARNIDLPSGVRIGRITPPNISVVLKPLTADQGPVSD